MSTKPQLPAEIQAQILREASEIISFPDLWRARAVNSFFASEVETIVAKAIRGRCNNGCFSSGLSNPLSGHDRQIQVRRLSLYLKTKEYPREPTVWSRLVDDILPIPNNRTTEETDAFLNKLIDAWLCDTAESRWDIMGKAQPKYNISRSRYWTEIYSGETEIYNHSSGGGV
ncbi:hypothetical protein N7499_001169 [Penicillium canescens]|uniref:Uncharacterized protein n=1 Tax=Penicillium canescens TaxID=5083 RepID=A0AAD6I2G4_PENCN|nr:uncharacterized protein N7446_003692 [Penicillium canescens]KAJ6027711.1 hypothetical protein N7460_012528 [Penicillium canescens]KAJ6040991.1 hypothetical protein N7444_009896 [Penicillium canescens]KAJ6066655.1 hypothetical protein N7446_003692 [Penicillium canescens]KAJ6101539.1 hypothetical protein N7499_001169 [Penicillium canescens]KAJ6173998.1 hypothetical protein N7485_006810 [Penicillium canescens]